MPHPTFQDSPEFLRLLRDESEPDLTRLALELARDAFPDLDRDACLARIDLLADRVRDRCREGASSRHIIGQINWVLFVEEKFRGNSENYYEPDNSYLNQVLDRRVGIPISLSTLYLGVAERIGLEMSGLNLPAHFMVRTGRGESALFVDPFHSGEILDRAGCEGRLSQVTGQDVALPDQAFDPCSTRILFLRTLRNLKGSYFRDHDFISALPVLRRLVALTRDDPTERRDLGISCLHAGESGEAIDHLAAYLAAHSQAQDAKAVTSLLRDAHRETAAWN